MRLNDDRTGEILVAHDWARSAVELHLGGTTTDSARIIRLTNEEARRLAALILFQAARLERPGATHGRPGAARGEHGVESVRKSA